MTMNDANNQKEPLYLYNKDTKSYVNIGFIDVEYNLEYKPISVSKIKVYDDEVLINLFCQEGFGGETQEEIDLETFKIYVTFDIERLEKRSLLDNLNSIAGIEHLLKGLK